jgi:uncharacterized protein YlxP (DUF503 family)
VHVLAVEIDLRIAGARSLKDKRQVIKPILEGSRRRFGVVASSHGHAQEVIDEVDRYVWSFPEVEMVSAERAWLESD